MFVGQYQPLLHLWYPHRHPLLIALRQVVPRLAVQPEADVLPVLLQLHVSVLARRGGHLVHAIVGHGVLIAEEDVLHAILPEARDVGGDGGAGSGALNKHHTPRGEDLSGVAGLYAADHGVGALNNGQSRIQPLDGDPAGKEAAHHHAAGQGFGSVLLCRGRDVIIIVVLVVVVLGIIGLFRLGGRPPVVAVVLHLLPGGVVAGQTAARHLVVIVGEGVIGDLADEAAADGRSFAAGAGARLGLHLGVAGDIDVIGVAGRRIRVCLAFLRTRAVADAGRAGAGGIQFFIRSAARGRHLAAGDFDVAARAVHTAADTGSTLAAHGLYRAAGDPDVSGTAFVLSADACAAVAAALSGEGAVLALVVLDGQRAFRLVFVLLKTRIFAAALQLVVAVQLDGGIAAALHGDGGFALMARAAVHLGLLAADVDLQVVEGDVHVAAGGVDGDGILLRLAGDDGLPLILLEILVALLDLVIVSASIARTFDRNVTVGDVPPGRIGRDAGAHHDARDDGGGHAPPECALQSHSLSSFGRFVF